MIRKPITLIILLLLLWATSLAQDSPTSKIDAYIKSEMQKQQLPGVAVEVMRNGEVILAKGYGLANVELQVPVTP